MAMRFRTTLAVILIVFAAIIATFLSGLYFTNDSLKMTMERDMAFAIGITDSLVATQMNLMKTKAVTIAGRLMGAGSDEEMKALMAELFDDYPDVPALFVLGREGVIASYSEPMHDHHIDVHDEYIEMARKGNTIISSPFYCSTEGEFVINIYTPLGPDRILSVTMPGLIFSDLLAKHKLWQTGDIFMLNETGTFIGAADKEIVLAMHNYITHSEENQSGDHKEMGDLIRKILSEPSGVASYTFNGVERICAYNRIEGSLLNWRVAVTVPLDESPQAHAMKGQAYSAALFLLSGTIAAFLLSRLTNRPFRRIAAQNRVLERLNETIRIQAISIIEEHERIKLMLDATPLACRLWSRDLKLLECNEAAVRLFKMRSKQEYIEMFDYLSPEFQPDGHTTREKIKREVSRAFEEGSSSYEWIYQLLDGTPIPTEINLVRVPYGDDYAVAAYSRDLREQKAMMADIEHRDHLLNTANRTASILFDSADNENIKDVIVESIELLGRSVKADRVHVMQNKTVDGALFFICNYAWIGDLELTGKAIKPGMSFPYETDPRWENDFMQGKCINGPVKKLPPDTQNFFASFGIVSMLVIPIFLQGHFWGRIGFSDCVRERVFKEDEVSILRSASLMIAAAINRNLQAADIREAHKRAKLLTNSTPLGFNLWTRNFENIETNDTAVKLFGLKEQKEYLERFFDLSPDYQPDGQMSRKKALAVIKEAFKSGYNQFEWLHQKLNGAQVPSEVTLVRIPYGDDYVVAGYIRDLREHKKIIADIEHRDNLLQIVNDAADILLRSEPEDFSVTIRKCMGMMASSIFADRMYLFKNNTKDGKLHFSQLYEWSENAAPYQDAEVNVSLPYDKQTPEIMETLLRGDCIHSLVRDLPPIDREQLGSRGVLAILVIPVFIQSEFWGFVGFDKCHSEQVFTENEESIMHSGSLLIANALLRNEYLLNIRHTTAQLEAALTDAKEANNAKSDFLASMSHEMRTPLNAIIGLSEIALDNPSLDNDAKSQIEKIYNSGSTLLSIVNDILDISKIQAGKFIIFPNQYDVPSLVNDAVLQNVLRIGSKLIRFSLDIDEKMPACLYGDELRIKQIINNLLSNAIKYTEEGSVELRLTSRHEEDTVWLNIRVTDTGIGISDEQIEHLFTNYSQFGSKVSQRAGGTGLGLVITKNLAEMMDGNVTVESEFGKGSVFTATLRQKYVNDAVIGSEVAKSLKHFQYSTNKLNRELNRIHIPYASVLIVDDNITNLDVARGLMKPYGMRIDCVTSGQAAVRAVREGKIKYNAIFMDHMMPDMDGMEAARIIRRDIDTEYAKKVPIIALTANAIAGSETMFLENGFQAFISKPIDLGRLDEVIRRFLRDKDQEALLEASQAETGPDKTEQKTEAHPDGLMILGQSIDGLNVSQGFERYGDEASYLQILRSYVINTKSILNMIEEPDKNLEEYGITVHGLKGASRNICAEQLGTLAEELEYAAKNGDANFVAQHNQAFIQAARRLVEDIESALEKIAKANPKPKKEKLDDEDLSRLYQACEEYDFSVIDDLIHKIESYEYTGDDGLAAWLLESITKMEFPKILERLSSLSKKLED